MITHIVLPEKQTQSLLGMKKYKKEKMLDIMTSKLESLFNENSHKIYPDIYNRTSFISFLSSFIITRKDEKMLDYFIDEDQLSDEKVNNINNNDFENYLTTGQIETKPIVQDEYINRMDRLFEDVRLGFNDYLSKDFWQDFKREDR